MAVLLFDIDGTLLLSGGAGTRALNALFLENHGWEGAMDKICPAGMTDPLIVEQIFRRFSSRPPKPSETEEVLEKYIPLLRKELAEDTGFRLMPCMPDVIEKLAADPAYEMGLATGNIRAAAEAKLEKAGMREFFTFGGFGCDHPSREGLVRAGMDRAAKRLSREIDPREVVVIGDTPKDIASAVATGARSVGVATGATYGVSELQASGADVVFEDLGPLAGWLNNQSFDV